MTNLVVRDVERDDLGGNLRHGDGGTFSPVLWRYLVDRFAVSSVLDVGCGEGHAVKYFTRMGITAHGIDGLRTNVDRAVTPVALHDLLAGSYYMPVDLVWSCEVAEHIDSNKVNYYLDTLCNGKIIAMTHALPGQIGHHHVNCQPPEYWIERMHGKGYTLSLQNDAFRKVAKSEMFFSYFGKSGLVFLKS